MRHYISEKALDALKSYEALRLRAYQDSAGVWTVGYGHTGKINPPVVQEGMVITEKEANQFFLNDIAHTENFLNSAVHVPLEQHQYDALVIFTFNVGCSAVQHSTLLKRLNEKRYFDVPCELMRWYYADKKPVQGLMVRRLKEASMWITGSTPS